MTSYIDRTIRAIQEECFVAIVDGGIPTAKVLEIGDALLASPILIMAVTLESTGALDSIDLLRARFGEHMWVGAGAVRTASQWDEAVDAGAQFSLAPDLDAGTVQRSRERDVLHIPGVLTAGDVERAYQAGCRMVQVCGADGTDAHELREIGRGAADRLVLATGGITPDSVGEYARAGAAAVVVGRALVTGADQPMADLITRARKFRAAWNEARRGRR